MQFNGTDWVGVRPLLHTSKKKHSPCNAGKLQAAFPDTNTRKPVYTSGNKS